MHQSNSSYWSGGRISESEKVCRDRLCRGKDREASNEKEGERRNDSYKVFLYQDEPSSFFFLVLVLGNGK